MGWTARDSRYVLLSNYFFFSSSEEWLLWWETSNQFCFWKTVKQHYHIIPWYMSSSSFLPLLLSLFSVLLVANSRGRSRRIGQWPLVIPYLPACPTWHPPFNGLCSLAFAIFLYVYCFCIVCCMGKQFLSASVSTRCPHVKLVARFSLYLSVFQCHFFSSLTCCLQSTVLSGSRSTRHPAFLFMSSTFIYREPVEE